MKKTILTVLIILLLTGCTFIEKDNLVDTDPQINSDKLTPQKRLDISNHKLTKLPNYVLQETALEELNISNNQIAGALPAEIKNLKNLKILNMSNNLMTDIPAEIGQLQNLVSLNLANNLFTGLPLELGNLKNLQTLIISGNNYSEKDLNIIKNQLPSTVHIQK